VIATVASVGSEFQREIVDTGRLAGFLFFVALLGTFGFIRTSTYLIRKQVSWWPGNVSVGGTHVHHLVWGIFAMMIFGYVGIVFQPDSPWREIIAVLFAIGMGLALDEFALWLELKDVYWSREGRKSVDAMIVAGCIVGALTVGFSAWVALADDVADGITAFVGVEGLLGIIVALVNVSKDKLWWALASLLIPVAGMPPAVRLAKPHSIWARLFYGDKKKARAGERYGAGAPAGAAPPESAAGASSPASSGAGQSSS
jgi:hypothetical protein